MAQWFRYYNEALDDPKVQKLKPELFKAWVNILSLASRNDGKISDKSVVAFALRVTEEKANYYLGALAKAGLIDSEDGELAPHNWEKRQYKSDLDKTANDRKKRQRERDKPVTNKNVTRDISVTSQPPETDTETDTETEQNIEGAAVPHIYLDDMKLAQKMWNDLAAEHGLSMCAVLTKPRMTKLKMRLQECGGIPGWATALDKVKASKGLLGDNERGWRADFDFLMQQSSFTKLMEGSYGHWTGTDQKPNSIKGGFARVEATVNNAIEKLRQREADESAVLHTGDTPLLSRLRENTR